MRRSRINPVSLKRQELNRKRRKFVKDILRIRLMCEARIIGCTQAPTDVHEILNRSQGGDILDPSGVLALCRQCHSYITTHPAFAYENGFSGHSWSTTADLVAAQRARNHFVFGEAGFYEGEFDDD